MFRENKEFAEKILQKLLNNYNLPYNADDYDEMVIDIEEELDDFKKEICSGLW